MRVIISPRAELDLVDIWTFIAAERQSAADRLILKIHARMAVLDQSPLAGVSRRDIQSGLRSLAMSPYVIFYAIEADEVVVKRVLDGRRDVTAILTVS